MVRGLVIPDGALPSHLSYAERCKLDPFNLNTLWRRAYVPEVLERMKMDEFARHEKAANAVPYQEGGLAYGFNPNALSGFVTNSSPPAANNTISFKPAHNQDLAPELTSFTHQRIARRNAHKHQIDYMINIRPDCETMNQTLRPFNTYATDAAHVEKIGVHVPPMILGPSDQYWHPDVRLLDVGWATAQHVADSMAPRDWFAQAGVRRPASAGPVYTGGGSRSPYTGGNRSVPHTQSLQRQDQQKRESMRGLHWRDQQQWVQQPEGVRRGIYYAGSGVGGGRMGRPHSAAPGGAATVPLGPGGTLPGALPHDTALRPPTRLQIPTTRTYDPPMAIVSCHARVRPHSAQPYRKWAGGAPDDGGATTTTIRPATALRTRAGTSAGAPQRKLRNAEA